LKPVIHAKVTTQGLAQMNWLNLMQVVTLVHPCARAPYTALNVTKAVKLKQESQEEAKLVQATLSRRLPFAGMSGRQKQIQKIVEEAKGRKQVVWGSPERLTPEPGPKALPVSRAKVSGPGWTTVLKLGKVTSVVLQASS
jgi:hypothetical protein